MDIPGIIDADHNGVPDIVESELTEGNDIVAQCPYTPGSPKAKAWWNMVEEHANEKSQYHGGPLRPGVNPGDKDFQFLVDKLRITKGYDLEHAQNIVAKVKGKIYG